MTKFDHECPEVVSESGTGGSVSPPADGIIDLVRPVVAFFEGMLGSYSGSSVLSVRISRL
jgi:hypothetical protein